MPSEFDSAFATFSVSSWVEGGEATASDCWQSGSDGFDGRAEPCDDSREQPHVGIGVLLGYCPHPSERFVGWKLN
jgi:hypothetical protein